MSLAASVVVPLAVAVLSFTVSFDLALADFRRTLAQRKALAAGLLAQLTVLPVLALTIGALTGQPAIAVAMVLVALVPSGPTSNFLAALGKGDVPLAVLLTVFGTLLSVATRPLLLPLLLGLAGLNAPGLLPPVLELLRGLVVMVLIPVGGGMWMARRFPAFVQRWRPAATRVASAVFVLLIAGAIAAEWHVLRETFTQAAHWVLLLNLAALAAGALVASAAGLPRPQVTVLGLKCAVQNVSIALGISMVLMQRTDIAAVAAMYGICQLLTALAFSLWRRRPASRTQAAPIA